MFCVCIYLYIIFIVNRYIFFLPFAMLQRVRLLLHMHISTPLHVLIKYKRHETNLLNQKGLGARSSTPLEIRSVRGEIVNRRTFSGSLMQPLVKGHIVHCTIDDLLSSQRDFELVREGFG